MLTKAKQFFRNPIYLLAVIVSLAVVGVGSALAFRAFAGGAPDGWTQEDADAVTTITPDVLYLDEGNHGDHVDVSFNVKREYYESSESYHQVNKYYLTTDTTYYSVKATLSGSKAVYKWCDENGELQNVPNPKNNGTITDLQPYLLSRYNFTSVYNDLADQIGDRNIWLYCTKMQNVQTSNGVYEDRSISFCCGSITIGDYLANLSRYGSSTVQLNSTNQPASQPATNVKGFDNLQTYTFQEAAANWGAQDMFAQGEQWNIMNYGFTADTADSFRVVLGSGDTPPVKGVVDAIGVGSLWGYTMPGIYAFYAPDYEYTARVSGSKWTRDEDATLTDENMVQEEVEYDDYSSFRLKKSPAGGFYFTETTGSATVPYAENTSEEVNGYYNPQTTSIPDETGIVTDYYSSEDDTKLIKTETVSKTNQSYSDWTNTQKHRTFTVTCTVKDSGGNVIGSFTQPSAHVSGGSGKLCFLSFDAEQGKNFHVVDNSAYNLKTVEGIESSGGLSAKMGVLVRYDMTPLNGYDVQYAPNDGYVSDNNYALENPTGDGDGNAAIISTYYSGISKFIGRGGSGLDENDGLFSRTVKLSGTSDANKAPMYSAGSGSPYRIIDGWQLANNDSDVFWTIGNKGTVNVTVEELFKSLDGKSGYDSGSVYDKAQNKFQFDPSTGFFLYTFTVKPIVGNTVSYVAEYSDGSGSFPLGGDYLPSVVNQGETVTVKDQLNIDGWTFDGWKIDEDSLPEGTTLADISNVASDGDGNATPLPCRIAAWFSRAFSPRRIVTSCCIMIQMSAITMMSTMNITMDAIISQAFRLCRKTAQATTRRHRPLH